MKEIFKNLKIVELASVLAGPSVGYFFSELGAQVIKIENPTNNGDITRSWKLKTEDANDKESAYYWSVNGGKEICWLDLNIPSQIKNFYALIKDADILICNFKKGDAQKLKADYKTLSKINNQLIWANINGFGANSKRTAYDLILQAESGFMSMNGEPGSQPVKMPVALIDVLAGHQMKEAILIALLHRFQTGKGAEIHVSLFQSAIASLVNQATNWLIANHLPKASGSLHPNIAPYGELFETKDKQLITFAIGSNKQFIALCALINYPNLANDRNYSSNQLRVKNRSQLYHILYNYINKIPFKKLFQSCLDKNIPIGKIRDLKEVFELPEAKEMLRNFENKKKKITTVSGIAFKIK
ncbi:MAG: CoA transferase [Sphingobacteriaceae bacterium]|nr:CoA transferase [Sphingobacteriaceae bacterium]